MNTTAEPTSLSTPNVVSIDNIEFLWRRSGYDHSHSPATPFVVYTCTAPNCLLDFRAPARDFDSILRDHARLHATAPNVNGT